MGTYYKLQDKLAALNKKVNPSTPQRLSDLMGTLYGGRGNSYDELQYLRNQDGDTTGVNDKGSDAWTKFAKGKSVVGNRADQLERDFYHKGNY